MSDGNSDDDAFESADEEEQTPPSLKPIIPSVVDSHQISVFKKDELSSEDSLTQTTVATPTAADAAKSTDPNTSTTPVRDSDISTTPNPAATATTATPQARAQFSPPPDPAAAPVADSWSSWGSWGASILSSASKSVSQFSSEVTEGLNVLVDASTVSVDEAREGKEDAHVKAAQQVDRNI